jgi:hypothetical protein
VLIKKPVNVATLQDEEQRRWEEEKRDEARRLENMKLSDDERGTILQVSK